MVDSPADGDPPQEVLRAGPSIPPSSTLGEAAKLLPGDTVHLPAQPGQEGPKVIQHIVWLFAV